MKEFDVGHYSGESRSFWEALAGALHFDDDPVEQGLPVLRAVFYTLRDLFSLEESLEFMEQLPVFLKALYREDWLSNDIKDEINDHDELLERVRYYLTSGENDGYYVEKEQQGQVIFQVLAVISRYSDIGEFVPTPASRVGTAKLPGALSA